LPLLPVPDVRLRLRCRLTLAGLNLDELTDNLEPLGLNEPTIKST
jgi:hypothetical protein